jgi:hypothetical protein
VVKPAGSAPTTMTGTEALVRGGDAGQGHSRLPSLNRLSFERVTVALHRMMCQAKSRRKADPADECSDEGDAYRLDGSTARRLDGSTGRGHRPPMSRAPCRCRCPGPLGPGCHGA